MLSRTATTDMPDSNEKNTNQSQSSVIRRAASNFGKLLQGRGVAAILELLTVGLLARSLTPELFGTIVLMQTYVLVIRGLLNFKLYEVLVKYGVPLVENKEEQSFANLLRLTLFIDFASTLTATILAIAGAQITALVLDWQPLTTQATMIYSLVLLTFGFGTAKGMLRMFDRFDLLALQLMIGPVLRLAGVVLIMMTNPEMYLFVIVLTLATAAGNLCLIVMGLLEMRRQIGHIPLMLVPPEAWQERFTGIKRFMIVLYWQGNVDMLPKHISTLLAGSLLGPAGAGLLRLARETTKILSKPGALLRQVLFPDLVRLWLSDTRIFGAIVLRAIVVSALVGALFILGATFASGPLLGAALGDGYREAAPLINWLLLATTIELMASVLRAAGYAIGHAGKILKLHLMSSVIYLLFFILLTPQMGLIGPGLAACLAAIVPFAGMSTLTLGAIRKKIRQKG